MGGRDTAAGHADDTGRAGVDRLAADLDLARRAALAGAAVGLRYFGAVATLPRERKADGSLVTEADRAVETDVRRVLLAERPGDACLGEETGAVGAGRRRWILDGIDGTAVFVVGDDRWQTLVALEEDGLVTVGVAVLPAQSRLWWAARGRGAHVAAIDGGVLGRARRLAVAPAPAGPGGCRFAVVPSLDALSPAHRSVAGRVPAAVGAQPSDWSAHPALLVAAGEMDATVQFGGAVWDHAALSLIVEEAGGVAAGLDGGGHPITGTACFACDPATWRTVRAAAASPRR